MHEHPDPSHHQVPATTDVVVVGAGLAGLAAATTAARAGRAVVLLDARAAVGGRARTDVVEGYALNQGPHALYRGMAAERVLRSLGVTPAGRPAPARGWARRGGELVRMPLNPIDVARSPMLGTKAMAAAGGLLGRPKRLLRTATDGRSMAEWIDEQTASDELRTLLSMLATVATYAADLEGIDAAAAVANLVGAATNGVTYLDGGWSQLVDALRARATSAGVRIVPGAKAQRLERAGERWAVHLQDGSLDAATVVLAAGGPVAAAHLLGDASAEAQRWAATERPVHATCLDVALRRLPVDRHRFVLDVDAPLYLSVHTPAARLAPADGGEVVHVMRYGGSDGEGDVGRAELEGLLELAQPGWRDEVVAQRYGRQLVVAHGRPEPGRGLAGRPGPVVPDAPGVLVAGDWVGGEGLLADAALASGALAGELAATPVAATWRTPGIVEPVLR